MIETLIIAIVSAIAVNLSAWWKNATADGKLEKYELKLAWPAALSGITAGLAAHFTPYVPDQIRPLIAAVGPVVVHNVAKGAFRHDWKAVIGTLTGAADLKNPEAPK